MKKKRLLLIIPALNSGGAEKSLVTLLSLLNYEQYEVDLFIPYKKGLFLKMLPGNLNILPVSEKILHFNQPLKQSIITLINGKHPQLIISRIMLALMGLKKSKFPSSQWSWKYISKSINKLDKKYDVAIGYLEGLSNYINVDKITANKKIGWIHNDYKMLKMNPTFDRPFFEQLNYIVTVSEKCKRTLNEVFPEFSNKTYVIHNIISPNVILKMANEENGFKDSFDGLRILSVGRLNHQKGFDLAIPAFSRLIKEGYKIKWYVIGEGQEEKNLRKMVADYGVESNFILMGTRENPYPYIKQSDIYAQPSRFEGKSVAIDEAKVLCKPILVTNFSTVKDQIKDKQNGIIVPINEEGIYQGLKTMIKNTELRSRLINNLSLESVGNEDEINMLYKLINS